MITTKNQQRLSDWLCTRAEIKDAGVIRCIGNVDDGRIKGVVGFDNWNGASMNIHVAGEGNWVTRDFLRAVFHYVFDECKAKVLIGLVDSGNLPLIKFNKHLGFVEEYVIADAHPSGALMVFTMRPWECRYLTGAQLWARQPHHHPHQTSSGLQKKLQLEMLR